MALRARSARVILAAAVLCLQAACSSTTFLYNRLDTVLPWYVDDYVDLDPAQQRQLDDLLTPFLAWHRAEELPRYLALLEKIDTELDTPVSSGEIAAVYADVENAWLRLQEASLEWLLTLGASLSDEQVREFLAYLQERQEEFEEEYLERSEREYREESYEALATSLQDYLGRLSAEQRLRLRAATLDLQRSDAVWLRERSAWLQRLEQMLQRRPGWQQQVREALVLRDETVSEQYRVTYQHNLEVIFSAIADVLDSRSDKQDQRLRAELADLRTDLQLLIGQGLASAS